jgi:hypothetical protein
LYNPKTKKFQRNTALEIIHSPILDIENEYILSQWTREDNIGYPRKVGQKVLNS